MATQAPLQPDRGTVTALALATSVRTSQLAIRDDLTRDVIRLWPLLNFSHLDATWPGWLASMQQLLTLRHQEAGRLASTLFRGTRQLELGEPGPAVIADPPNVEWTSKALGYAAPGVWEKQLRAEIDNQQAERAAIAQTINTSARIALDGARQTMLDAAEQEERTRFFRVTDGDPCYFCALLASRGAVYREAFTAGDGNTYHDSCGCTVGVTFVRGHALDPVSAQAADVYNGVAHLSGKDRVRAFRREWESRNRG